MHSDLISCENSLYVWYKTHLRETCVILAIDMGSSVHEQLVSGVWKILYSQH